MMERKEEMKTSPLFEIDLDDREPKTAKLEDYFPDGYPGAKFEDPFFGLINDQTPRPELVFWQNIIRTAGRIPVTNNPREICEFTGAPFRKPNNYSLQIVEAKPVVNDSLWGVLAKANFHQSTGWGPVELLFLPRRVTTIVHWDRVVFIVESSVIARFDYLSAYEIREFSKRPDLRGDKWATSSFGLSINETNLKDKKEEVLARITEAGIAKQKAIQENGWYEYATLVDFNRVTL